MKKFLLNWTTVLMVAILSVGFISCSSDDDEGGSGGSGSTTTSLDGKKVSFYSNAYWYTAFGSMHINFCSFNLLSGKPSFPMNYMSISYDIDESQTGVESVTLTSGNYDIYLAVGVTMSDEGWQGETDWKDTQNSPLVIERNGNNVTIKIEKVNVGDDNIYKTFAFSYSGPLTLLPEEYRD